MIREIYKMSKIWWIMLVVIAVGAWWIYTNKTIVLPGYGNPSSSSSPTPSQVKSYKSSKKPTAPEPSSMSTDYTALIQQYSDKKVQFNEFCHGIPGQLVVKKGQQILLDNRSADTKTIRLDSQTYVLSGYGYKVVVVSTSNPLPYSLGIDCRSANGSTENGTAINIQANILH